jgi:hypothetical protein
MAAKFLLVLAAVAPSLLGVTWVGIAAQHRATAQAEDLYTDHIVEAQDVSAVDQQVSAIGRLAFEMISETDADQLAGQRTRLFYSLLPQAAGDIAALRSTAAAADDRQLWAGVAQSWREFRAVLALPAFQRTSREVTSAETNDRLSPAVEGLETYARSTHPPRWSWRSRAAMVSSSTPSATTFRSKLCARLMMERTIRRVRSSLARLTMNERSIFRSATGCCRSQSGRRPGRWTSVRATATPPSLSYSGLGINVCPGLPIVLGTGVGVLHFAGAGWMLALRWKMLSGSYACLMLASRSYFGP